MSSAVLTSYRNILRASGATFTGDAELLKAFRQEIRGHFEKNRNETDEKKLKKMLKQSVDLEKMVRMNLVQGKQTGVDNTIEVRTTGDTEMTDMKKSRCK